MLIWLADNFEMARRLTYLLLLASGGLLLANVLMRFGGASVWDDAYFYARYADNFIQSNSFSWNVGQEAYGLTSPIYGILLTPIRLLGGDPDLPLLLLSLAWLGLALWVGRSLLRSAPGEHSPWLWTYAGALLLLQGPALATLATSGMETLFAAAYLGVFVIGIKRFRWGLRRRALLMGLAGGAAFILRPELLLFTLGLPLGLLLFSKSERDRTLGGYMLLFGTFAAVSCAVVARQLFADLLPLAFYAKSAAANAYGPLIVEKYRFWALREGAGFALVNAPAFLGILLAGVLRPRQAWRSFGLVDRILLGLLAFFLAYEAFGVVQVMGGAHRFYQPVTLLLAYLGWRGWTVLLAEWGDARLAAWQAVRRLRFAAWSLAVAGVLAGSAATLWLRPANVTARVGQFGLAHAYEELGQHNWPFLREVSALPAECVLAATELGILGAMNMDKEVVDLSGLNDREVLAGLRSERGMACEYVLQERRPDVIYLPHPDYVRMAEALADCGLAEGYAVYSADSLGSYLGMALRRDSPYFENLAALLEGQ